MRTCVIFGNKRYAVVSVLVLIKVEGVISTASYQNINFVLLGAQRLEHVFGDDFDWWEVMEENDD